MEKYLYTCQYCAKEYKPNRRKKQKYCSNSCRTRAFVLKNASGVNMPSNNIKKDNPTQIEKISLAGIGNAAAGTLAVNLASRLFTKEENKPATKKDIDNLLIKLNQRYYPILNIPQRQDGARAFYDLQNQFIVYLKN